MRLLELVAPSLLHAFKQTTVKGFGDSVSILPYSSLVDYTAAVLSHSNEGCIGFGFHGIRN